MRRSELRIVDYSKHSKSSPWMISGVRENGKRKRLFFATHGAAKKELARIKIKQRREGEEALKLPDWLRITALQCAKDLAEFPGVTIRDATDHYLKYLRDSRKPNITVSGLVTQFLDHQRRLKRSEAHQDDLKLRLEHFSRTFGDRTVRQIEPHEIKTWLQKLKLGPQSLHNYRSRLSNLFGYAMKNEYTDRNPVIGIELQKLIDAPPEIFTPEQLRLVLDHARSADLLPLLAIGAFAGLRTAELLRLEWKDISIGWKEEIAPEGTKTGKVLPVGHVKVETAKSKTARRRVVTMPANLRAWLGPYAGRTGKLWELTADHFHGLCRKIAADTGLTKWPKNGLRHSFASYHAAKHKNAPELAADMGHTGVNMLYNHYREVVTPDEAELYWQISPPTPAGNVVPMAQAS